MVATLAIYVSLWRTGRSPGAGTVALGILLTLVAAIVQTSSLRASLIWEFDHNGLFHLVQMAGLVVVARGVRTRLTSTAGAHRWQDAG
jgi:hypothetical protein